MKAKIILLTLFTLSAVFIFTGSTVWEGSADVISSGDLQGGGYCVATNSFPQNTIVDITNLENNKSVRVIVVAGIDSTGLLATLSRDAADSIGIRENSVSRIRMTQPSEAIAFSRYRQQNLSSDEPATVEPAAIEPVTVEDPPEAETVTAEIILVPTEERIPKAELPALAQEDFIDPIETAAIETVTIETAAVETAPVEEYIPPQDFSPFQAPLITGLEHGKWYVQIGAYTKTDVVEDEISRIGAVYPIAVQNIGTDISPVFRLLLGPLNQGESGAILQRVKSIGYNDAFIRISNQ